MLLLFFRDCTYFIRMMEINVTYMYVDSLNPSTIAMRPVVKYFLYFFNFQGFTSLIFRDGSFRISRFIQILNLIISNFMITSLMVFMTIHSEDMHEYVNIEEGVQLSKSLKLISTVFLNFQLVISIVMPFWNFKKQRIKLKFLNNCLKVIELFELQFKTKDISNFLVYYLIFQACIVLASIFSYIQNMRIKWETAAVFVFMFWSTSVSFYFILVAIIFFNFLNLLMDQILLTSINDSEEVDQIELKITIVRKLEESFLMAFGNQLNLSFIYLTTMILFLVRIIFLMRKFDFDVIFNIFENYQYYVSLSQLLIELFFRARVLRMDKFCYCEIDR